MSVDKDDKLFREKGNEFFKLQKYEEAVEQYTNAIGINDQVIVYYTNRALCNIRLKRYDAVCVDCWKAIDLDPNSLKGRVYLGMALIEMGLFDDAFKHLHCASNLAMEQKVFHGDEIASLLRKARKMRFAANEEKRIRQEIELASYLYKRMDSDYNKEVNNIRNSELPEDVRSELLLKSQTKFELYKSELQSLFAKNDERRKKREVPDYLCGKISFEIMHDPVITPSGITYDRKCIEEHLQRIGHFDPITRQSLTQDQLIPNYVMKEVIDNFLADNEWAIEF